MIKPKQTPWFSVVGDSPTTLVLEAKGPRAMAAIGTIAVVLLLFFGPFRLDQPIQMGATDVTLFARIFFGLILLQGIVGALDRQQIVFASGTVRFTSRAKPWKRLVRSVSEIDRVETSSKTTTQYDVDSVTHYLHIVFRDQGRREINRCDDAAFIKALGARIEEFRRS